MWVKLILNDITDEVTTCDDYAVASKAGKDKRGVMLL